MSHQQHYIGTTNKNNMSIEGKFRHQLPVPLTIQTTAWNVNETGVAAIMQMIFH